MKSIKRRIWGLSTSERLVLVILGLLTYAAWSIWGRPIFTFVYYSSTGVANAALGLESDDELVRQAAARSLGENGEAASSTIPELLLAMHDESSAVASDATWAIGQILSSYAKCPKSLIVEITASLQDALNHKNGEVRRYATYALCLNPAIAKASVPRLKALLRDPQVAYMAARTLGEIGGDARGATPEIADLLVSTKSGDRAEAALALSKLQPLPTNIIVTIEKLLDDEVDFVRAAAQKALNVIDTSPKSG